MPSRLEKIRKVAFTLIGICLLVSSCSSVPERGETPCMPLVMSPQAIGQAMQAKEVFRVETDRYLYTLVNVKLHDRQALVGIDRSVDEEVTIPVSEIESICTLPAETYAKKRAQSSISRDDLAYAPLLIMLPAVPLAPFFQSPSSEGMTKEEVKREIGEPKRRYICGSDALEVWEYEEGKLYPEWTSVEGHNFVKFRWWDDLFWPGVGTYSEEGLDILGPCRPHPEEK